MQAHSNMKQAGNQYIELGSIFPSSLAPSSPT
ncbi:hypothetical protein AB1N83_013436 [Pleurotus pulmonarius]